MKKEWLYIGLFLGLAAAAGTYKHCAFQKIKNEQYQKTFYEIYTDIVALGNYIEKKFNATEDKIFFLSGVRKLISPYDKTIDSYCKEFDLQKSEII